MEVMTMHEQEKLYEQYEDAVFALLMDKVAEENGKKLLQQNEELLADPDAAVPETLSKRCLRTIEKAYRKSQWKAAAKKVTRALNRVALWILVPLFLFGTAFAASETVRVKTLNFLVTNFEFGTEFRIDNSASSAQQESMMPTIENCIPSDYELVAQSSTSLFENYMYANDSDSEVNITIYSLENTGGAVTIDTEDAEVWYNTIFDQSVMFVQKADTYQAVWTDIEAQKMYALTSSNTALDVVCGIVEKVLCFSSY